MKETTLLHAFGLKTLSCVLRRHIFKVDLLAVRREPGDRTAGDGIPLFCRLRVVGSFVSRERSGAFYAAHHAEHAVAAGDRNLIQRRRAVLRDEIELPDVAKRRAVRLSKNVLLAVGLAHGDKRLALVIGARERGFLVLRVLVGDGVLVALLVVDDVLCAIIDSAVATDPSPSPKYSAGRRYRSLIEMPRKENADIIVSGLLPMPSIRRLSTSDFASVYAV